ncbi:short-chain dehydrogenase [Kordiimonas sediminis]|uniref:Short-chain dehydrogenase n=1 Tax=Kordiimonas sediminis TaxID=1735581 RepID=A0A919E3U8_9PROT|nr:SDR family NAD(P)-dependent oxidoreductase [Kordiimonas sediminis]GHF10410.1 short-chain dehydrogenase [Kordiimonas sediminis]
MEYQGKNAFITGAASGIGFAIAEAFANRGTNILLADIDAEALEAAKKALSPHGVHLDTYECDVAKPENLQKAADYMTDTFGHIHFLVNNAGVGLSGAVGTIDTEDWRWIVDINLLAVTLGCEIFLPRMQAHGESGYIINTASMAGHLGAPEMPPYVATKFAVVGYSESLRGQLLDSTIGVSVLCPGWVNTNIHTTQAGSPSRNRAGAPPAAPSPDDIARFKEMEAVIRSGLAPEKLARWVLECIDQNRFYIFSAPEMRGFLQERAQQIDEDYAACDTWFANSSSDTP